MSGGCKYGDAGIRTADNVVSLRRLTLTDRLNNFARVGATIITADTVVLVVIVVLPITLASVLASIFSLAAVQIQETVHIQCYAV